MQLHEFSQQQVSTPRKERPAERIQHIHDVLSDPYRSALLYYLQESDGPVDARDAAEQVLTWCQDGMQIDGDEFDADDAREWLLQSHVLSMHEFGLITYDSRQDTISLPDDVSITISPHWDQ